MHPKEVSMSSISRRRFLTTTATAAGGIALGCSDRSIIAPPLARLAADPLPDPAASGIEHVIVFMMENRSFDHFLGWLPRPDVPQSHLPARRPDRPDRKQFRDLAVADDLGPAGGARASGPVLLRRPAVPGIVGRQVRADWPPAGRILCRLCGRHAPARGVRRWEFRAGAHGYRGGRPSVWRRPRRRGDD